ncbi:lysosomal thiol reductase IP30 isoform X1 [Bombyx mori]|uniref:Lysosomal thiol reductase IP30 n=2 Tax=Bombyx mori TaxID=7091 RepID=A0A8R2M6I4_BOMMO|nr:lysosomal thiol reductase IP30 isoform X2 [Bombyx mori]XP_037875553.1 lysosomal thiol reductase IP30 isoform X2 [Bombyx mori]
MKNYCLLCINYLKKNKMKTLRLVCFLMLLCYVVAKKKTEDHKVKIAVYYESLCPDSKKFITTQLAPVWRDFRGLVKVKMVPYGKSTHDKVDGKWSFICHHGADECYGNKVQACVLKDRNLQDTEKMEIVICLMNQTSPDKSLDTCLTQVDKMSESDKLKRCASSEQGDNLLASYGDKTDAVMRPLAFVPTVIINEKYDKDVETQAFENLKAVVCRVATPQPSICS